MVCCVSMAQGTSRRVGGRTRWAAIARRGGLCQGRRRRHGARECGREFGKGLVHHPAHRFSCCHGLSRRPSLAIQCSRRTTARPLDRGQSLRSCAAPCSTGTPGASLQGGHTVCMLAGVIQFPITGQRALQCKKHLKDTQVQRVQAHLCRDECCAMWGRTSLTPARPLRNGKILTNSLSPMSSYQDTMGTPLLI